MSPWSTAPAGAFRSARLNSCVTIDKGIMYVVLTSLPSWSYPKNGPAGKVSGSTNNCPRPGIKSSKGTRSLTAAYGASGGAVNGALSAARVCAETNEKNTAVAKAVAVIDEWIMTFLQFVRAECRTWPIRCKERLFRFSGERAFASVGTTSWFRRPPARHRSWNARQCIGNLAQNSYLSQNLHKPVTSLKSGVSTLSAIS